MQPIINIPDSDFRTGKPSISIEIVGATLALLMVFTADAVRDVANRMHVYNWKTGALLLVRGEALRIDWLPIDFFT